MINLHPINAIWLVEENEVAQHFVKAVATVRTLYKKYYGAQPDSAADRVESVFRRALTFERWGVSEVQLTLEATFRNSNVHWSEVDPRLSGLSAAYEGSISQLFRLVFITLWARKVFVAPLGMQTIAHMPEVFDMLCEKLNVENLTLIRGVHPESKIKSLFKREEFDSGSSRVNFWLRLLLSTTAYTIEDLSQSDVNSLFSAANGSGQLPLRRYYVNDFLLTLSSQSAEKKKMVEDVINQYQLEKRENKPARVYKGRIRIGKVQKKAESAYEKSYAAAQEIASGVRDMNFAEDFSTYFPSHIFKKIFYIGGEGEDSLFYESSRYPVKLFSSMVNGFYKSFMHSMRLQNSTNHEFVLGLLMSYVMCYLPNFFLQRDGDLLDYPKNLNDFNCTLFFTRESVFLEGVILYEKEPPRTFIGYVNEFSRVKGWGSDTLYARVGIIDRFCDYVEDNNLVLPGADKFKNNFTSACYPAVSKRSGTDKVPVPRPYFSTFISMLDSLEYLVDHINCMPYYDGQSEQDVNYGVLGGELYQPSTVELTHSHAWAGLIGRNVKGIDEVNQSLLNYTPIFYHENKIQTFKFLPRFYKIVDIEIRGVVVSRISPNEVRLTQLMCHTGIRQQHLIWLDKDRYDRGVDRYRSLPFQPMFVSSDKSHGEWTAIVAMRAIEIMDRQRKWYDACTSPSFKQDLWYGMVEGSKFGRYKPLFRGQGNTDSDWNNSRQFRVYMLILQYFIRVQMQDASGEDLVFVKSEGGSPVPFLDYSPYFLRELAVSDLVSPHTPHALRAGFVSDAIRLLPPSIIGQYLTGQSEALVWYYAIFDGDNLSDHQQLLADYMMKNMQSIERGDAPELAETVLKLHAKLMTSIEKDPVQAIKTHGLISLAGVADDKNGLETLRARLYTKLAFNNCHICPFDNRCPKEVVSKIGGHRQCALCPYAIRGIDHLQAVSAEKDKAKEMMKIVLDKIQEYRTLKPSARNPQILENLYVEYDHHALEAYALEAIEQQLYLMAQTGEANSFFLREKDGLMAHFQKVEISESDHVLKRLVDVQNFPDLSSPRLDAQFAQMRMRMLVNQGKYDELLKPSNKPASHQLASQISSMMTTGMLSVRDVMKISHDSANVSMVARPALSLSANMGLAEMGA